MIDAKNRTSLPAETEVEVLQGGNPLLQISGITPASGSPGDKIILTGSGFSAKGTTVALGKVAANMVESTDTRVQTH